MTERDPNILQTVAIMQPYYIPYAGYFRLLVAADLFVIYDCVQFTRRGWVHRNQLFDAAGNKQWLSLPIQKAPQETLIRDLSFREGASDEMINRLRRFPALTSRASEPLVSILLDPVATPVDHIEKLLHFVAGQLNLPWRVIRSSSLNIDSSLRGQDRILAIISRLGAQCYVNAPGGRTLYDKSLFEAAGVTLRFLRPYEGNCISIAERLLSENPATVASEIRSRCSLLP